MATVQKFLTQSGNQLITTAKITIIMDGTLFKSIKSSHSVTPTSAVSIDFTKYVKTMYIFKVLHGKDLYDVYLPVVSSFEYNDRQKVVVDNKEYKCFTLEKDMIFMESNNNIKSTEDLKLFLDKYLAGKFQNIPYEKQLSVQKAAFDMNSTKSIGVDDVALETLIRSLNRTKDDINVPFSNVFDNDPHENQRLMVPMKTIIMTEANAPGNIGFEHIHNTLTNVLLNSDNDELAPLSETDKLLHGIKG